MVNEPSTIQRPRPNHPMQRTNAAFALSRRQQHERPPTMNAIDVQRPRNIHSAANDDQEHARTEPNPCDRRRGGVRVQKAGAGGRQRQARQNKSIIFLVDVILLVKLQRVAERQRQYINSQNFWQSAQEGAAIWEQNV